MVSTMTLKELRPELPKVINRIDERFDRYIITRRGKPVVVMIGIEDYESLVETLDILADDELMKGIREGLQDAKKGRIRKWAEVKRDLEKL